MFQNNTRNRTIHSFSDVEYILILTVYNYQCCLNIHFNYHTCFISGSTVRISFALRWIITRLHSISYYRFYLVNLVQNKMYPETTTNPTLNNHNSYERNNEINSIWTSSLSSMQKPLFMVVLIVLGTIGTLLNIILVLPLMKNPTNSNK